MHPTFSIVVPAYNRPRELARALRSCIRQSFSDFEVVVIDDGSEEDIASVVRSFNDPRFRYVRQANRGGGSARNRGVSLANGNYIAFLDSDDIFLQEKLAVMFDMIKGDPYSLYFSPVLVDRGVGRLWIKPRIRIADHDSIYDFIFLRQGWVPISTVVVAKALARRVPFNEDLACGQDVQFAIDAARLGTRLVMLKEPLVICDDRRSPVRVSQKANVDAAGVGPYQPYLDWVENSRPMMSTRAYNAWRAKFKARLIVADAPREALGYLWSAYRSGAFTSIQTLRQAIQIFAPNLYWKASNLVAKWWGMNPTDGARMILELDESGPGTYYRRRRQPLSSGSSDG